MPSSDSPRLAAARAALAELDLLNSLSRFDPTVVSTIWVGLDLPNSDIDVICSSDPLDDFIEQVAGLYGGIKSFRQQLRDDHALARFEFAGFTIELYCSELPVSEQMGFLNYSIMLRLVELAGEPLQEELRALKDRGRSTEAAIAALFNLKGDPYQAVLTLRDWSDQAICEALRESPRQTD